MSKKKPMILNRTAQRRLEDSIAKRMLILSAAYLMDELGYGEDELCDYWDSLTRWVDAIDEKLITVKRVCEIIESHTGLKIK